MIALLTTLQQAPSTAADEVVGYVKPGPAVLEELIAGLERLQEEWQIVNW